MSKRQKITHKIIFVGVITPVLKEAVLHQSCIMLTNIVEIGASCSPTHPSLVFIECRTPKNKKRQ
jgi:hypothetical protein